MQVLVLTLHIAAASLWLGGMLFMVIVLSPWLRKQSIRDEAYYQVGKRFSLAGTFIALPLLFLTGLYNAYSAGVNWQNFLSDDSPFFVVLRLKVWLFAGLWLLALLHDLWLGPKAARDLRYRLPTRLLGLLNLLLSVLILALAARLRFGGMLV